MDSRNFMQPYQFKNGLVLKNRVVMAPMTTMASFYNGQITSDELGKRTLQNEMAAIRQTLRAEGRTKLADSPRISNKALGLSGASRAGTKRAITNPEYQEVHQKALQKNEELAAAIELAHVFGLRGEEAVQSIRSLKTWQTAIENGNTKIRVV